MYSSILSLACVFPKRSTNVGTETLNFEDRLEFVCSTVLLHNGESGITLYMHADDSLVSVNISSMEEAPLKQAKTATH